MEKIGVILGAAIATIFNFLRPTIEAFFRELEAKRNYKAGEKELEKEGQEYVDKVQDPNSTEEDRKKALDDFLN